MTLNARVQRRGLTEILIFVGSCMSFLILSGLLFSHFRIGDDTYIYLQYVRNIINGNGISFNMGEPSYGFTSVVWLGLLLLIQLVVGDYLLTPIVLSLVVGCFLVYVYWNQTRKEEEGGAYLLVACLLFVLDPNMLKHVYLGMETLLSGALTLLAYIFHEKERKQPHAFPFSGLVWGIAVLNRPEVVLIIGLILLDLILHRNSVRRIIFWTAGIGAPLFLWGAFAYSYFGTIVPNTVIAKGAGYPLFGRFIENLRDSVLILFPVYAIIILVFLKQVLDVRKLQLADRASWWKHHWLLYGIPVIYILGLCSAVNNEFVYSRYFYVCIPLMIYGAVRFFRQQSKSLPLLWRTIVVGGTALQFLLLGSWMGYQSSQVFPQSELAKVQLHRWIKENTPRKSSILTGAIGRIGFESERKIICSMGLINPGLIEFKRWGRELEYFTAGKPDFAVVLSEDSADVGWANKIGESRVIFSVTRPRRLLLRQFIEKDGLPEKVYMNLVALDWQGMEKDRSRL